MKITSVNRLNNSLKIFNNKTKTNNTLKKASDNKAIIPFVAMPLVAYVLRNENDAKKSILNDALNNRYILPNEKTNMKVISELEEKKIIEVQKPWQAPRFNDGVLTKTGYEDVTTQIKNSNLSEIEKEQYLKQLKIANYRTFGHVPQEHLDNFYSSDSGFATIEPDHHGMGFGQISAGFGELELPDSADITEQLGHVADMLDNPVLEGVAAELLPGTKFLKPGKDLIDGDYEKAA